MTLCLVIKHSERQEYLSHYIVIYFFVQLNLWFRSLELTCKKNNNKNIKYDPLCYEVAPQMMSLVIKNAPQRRKLFRALEWVLPKDELSFFFLAEANPMLFVVAVVCTVAICVCLYTLILLVTMKPQRIIPQQNREVCSQWNTHRLVLSWIEFNENRGLNRESSKILIGLPHILTKIYTISCIVIFFSKIIIEIFRIFFFHLNCHCV